MKKLVSFFFFFFSHNNWWRSTQYITRLFIAKGGFKLAAFGVKQGGIGSLLAGGFPGLKKTGGAKPEPATPHPPVVDDNQIAPPVPAVSKPTPSEPVETQKARKHAIITYTYKILIFFTL